MQGECDLAPSFKTASSVDSSLSEDCCSGDISSHPSLRPLMLFSCLQKRSKFLSLTYEVFPILILANFKVNTHHILHVSPGSRYILLSTLLPTCPVSGHIASAKPLSLPEIPFHPYLPGKFSLCRTPCAFNRIHCSFIWVLINFYRLHHYYSWGVTLFWFIHGLATIITLASDIPSPELKNEA